MIARAKLKSVRACVRMGAGGGGKREKETKKYMDWKN